MTLSIGFSRIGVGDAPTAVIDNADEALYWAKEHGRNRVAHYEALIGDGETYWSDGPLTRAVREGGICYLDEVVEARKDTTVVIHPLADHRRVLPIDRTGEVLHAPGSFMLVVSYNPGYQNFMKGMKPSTRQRFVSLRFDFPGADREEAILIGEAGCDTMTAKRLVSIGRALRAVLCAARWLMPRRRARANVCRVFPLILAHSLVPNWLFEVLGMLAGCAEVGIAARHLR